MRNRTANSFDVVIVGGGMVGSALACALALEGFSIAVVESREPAGSWPRDELDLRVSALTRASQHILHNLGVWERMCAMRVSPYREMHVWDAGGSGSIHFDCAEIGEPDLGHIVENRVTQLALWERLGSLSKVRRLCPAAVTTIDLQRSRPVATLEDGEVVQADLLVAADGARSALRGMAGIATQGWAYGQHAVVANVRPEKSHRETAWQRFMPSGPLAFLPIDDGRCSIVWSTSPQHAKELLALDEAAFCRDLGLASEHVLGTILETGPRAQFPLRLRHAKNYVARGLALVGDAAHTVHPLAGQGVNLGFLDAAALADTLVDAREAGRQLGDLNTLRRYERTRKGANLGMLAAMDGFKRLFGNDITPLRLVRNLGLNLTDAATPIKHLITRRALGTLGELPRLARHSE